MSPSTRGSTIRLERLQRSSAGAVRGSSLSEAKRATTLARAKAGSLSASLKIRAESSSRCSEERAVLSPFICFRISVLVIKCLILSVNFELFCVVIMQTMTIFAEAQTNF